MGLAIWWVLGLVLIGLAFSWKVAFFVWLAPVVLALILWLAHIVITVFDK